MAATGHRSRPLDSASDVSAGLARLTADPIAYATAGTTRWMLRAAVG